MQPWVPNLKTSSRGPSTVKNSKPRSHANWTTSYCATRHRPSCSQKVGTAKQVQNFETTCSMDDDADDDDEEEEDFAVVPRVLIL